MVIGFINSKANKRLQVLSFIGDSATRYSNRSYNCTPVSSPALPSLARHPLWAAWEHTLDLALAQLPALLDRPQHHNYHHSPFFRDQLTAFQLWLDLGNWSVQRPPPEQLPMVLQVLLSTLHRVRALQILCRFLSLGAWAVRAVLAVGIFPYMLKLLQASASDLRASMVYIWAKIVAVDPVSDRDSFNVRLPRVKLQYGCLVPRPWYMPLGFRYW